MKRQIAFVGDIHGEIDALEKALLFVKDTDAEESVFLGDYINRGRNSKQVIDRLIEFERIRKCTFIRGNHDQLMINALSDAGAMGAFLKIGGAATIRSYLSGKNVESDVYRAFQEVVPSSHKRFLASTVSAWGTSKVYATHAGPADPKRLSILGHSIVDRVVLRHGTINIDTGCGQEGGKLTVLLYPSLEIRHFPSCT